MTKPKNQKENEVTSSSLTETQKALLDLPSNILEEILATHKANELKKRQEFRKYALSLIESKEPLSKLLEFLKTLDEQALNSIPSTPVEIIPAPVQDIPIPAHTPSTSKFVKVAQVLTREQTLSHVKESLYSEKGLNAIEFSKATGLDSGEMGWYVNEVHKKIDPTKEVLKNRGEKRAKTWFITAKES